MITKITNLDHVVKAKEINSEIVNKLNENIKPFDKKMMFILFSILSTNFLILFCITFQQILMPSIFYITIFVLFFHIINAKVLWKLKIENKKIYIKSKSRTHIINYSDLIFFEIKPIRKAVFGSRYSTREYAWVNFLFIGYLKNKKLKGILLEIPKHLNQNMEQVCKSFIRNSQLSTFENQSNDYFDICNTSTEAITHALEAYNTNRFWYYMIVPSLLTIFLIWIPLLVFFSAIRSYLILYTIPLLLGLLVIILKTYIYWTSNDNTML